MAARWWENDATANPAAIAAALIVHPFDSEWQDKIVTTWGKAHPQQIKRGESATEWEALEKAHKQEAIDAINASRKNAGSAWNYLNSHYQTIFGSKNQVRK